MALDHQPNTSSGLKSADAAISDIGAYLNGVLLIPDGTNACSIIIYDNASAASGLVLAKLALPASSTTPLYIEFHNPVSGNKGLYADVTGTGANYIVYYSQGI